MSINIFCHFRNVESPYAPLLSLTSWSFFVTHIFAVVFVSSTKISQSLSSSSSLRGNLANFRRRCRHCDENNLLSSSSTKNYWSVDVHRIDASYGFVHARVKLLVFLRIQTGS